MFTLRPAVYLLLAGLLAGCSLYRVDYRLWNKTNAPDDELTAALAACEQEARVGSVVGNSDPRTYFIGPVTPEQTQANRLFQKCMVSRDWYPAQPLL